VISKFIMDFEELQRNLDNKMSFSALKKQKQLLDKVIKVQDIIQPVFSYKGEYTIHDNPAEWLSLKYFDKLNYILVSLHNVVRLNDEFFSWLALKYIYEFYIKLKYISSAENDDIFSERIQKYLSLGQRDNFADKVKKLEGEDPILLMFKNDHKEMYRLMNSVAHPNVESLNLHKVKHTDDDRFNGLSLNLQLCMYLIYGVIETIVNDSRFSLVNKPDLIKIKSIVGN